LLDVAEEKNLNGEELQQLSARMRVYWLVLKNFYGFFSLLRDKQSNMESGHKMEELKMFLDTALQCWWHLNISVTPKLHLLEDHLFDILENVKTLEYFDEEFVERAHQKGLKYNRITKGMSQNPIKKYNYMVRWELAHSKTVLERVQDRIAHNDKRGQGKRMKVECQEKGIASREMALDEFHALAPHYFQTADAMNGIILKRLAEQQIQVEQEGIL